MREVIRNATFEQACAAIDPDAKRMDEVLRGIEWAVCADPQACPEIPGTSLRIVKTDSLPGAPAVRVYFTIRNAQQCELLWIEETPRNLLDEEDLDWDE